MAPALGALVGLALVAVAAFGSLAALRAANGAEAHTRDVLRRSADFESAFLSMVSELRGYQLDGNPGFLSAYRQARQELDDEYAALRALVADNPPQVARVERMRALVDTWQAEVADLVLGAAITGIPMEVRTERGTQLVSAVRAQREAFHDVELSLLRQRAAVAEEALQRTFLAIAAALLLELLLLGLTGVLATRSITRPLDRLAAVARHWARGELDARVGLTSRDELGLVSRTFDDMAERLAADRAALVAANRGHRLLQELNARLVTDDPTAAPLRRALAVFEEQLGFSAVAVWWQQDGTLVLLDEHGLLPAAAGRTQPRAVGEGIVGQVTASGTELVIANAQTAPETAHARPWLVTGGLHSVVGLPLLGAAGVRGALLLASVEPRSPDPDTLVVLRNAAQRLTLVLERREAHARLEASNRALEQATRAKSDFLAAMSHELRTPLNSIIGFSDLLLDEPTGDPLAERRHRYVSHIHESGRHLLNLVNDILDLGKVEAGRMDVHATTFDVTASLAAVEAVIRPLAQKKNLTLTTDVAPDVTTLHADEGKFKQVLYNLLSNAVKFTPEGGHVATTARLVGGYVELAVTDTGIGIAPEDQERVFQEFQQLDTGAGRRHEGTGLGLALSRRLVELQGGRIWLESEPGRGSRFAFTVPAPSPSASLPVGDGGAAGAASPARVGAAGPASGGQEAHAGEAASRRAGETPLVLVVEDDQAARELLCTYLTQAGYRVAPVGSGTNVVEQVRALRPAAVTLDVLLPGRDGWDVLQALKAEPATVDIPVVIVSVVDNEHLGYALGATAYLVKPIAQTDLLRVLERVCPLGRLAQPAAGADVPAPTALVVDDEARARELVTTFIEPTGFRVLEAATGEEGLALAMQHHPDIVLLDLLLPGLSGFEVVERLKADPATREIPIVILSAKDLTPTDRRALNGQIAALVSKSGITRERFLTELECVLNPPALTGAVATRGGDS